MVDTLQQQLTGSVPPATRMSVVVCTFNGAMYLLPQLDSIAGQHTPPDEIIISDDGSSDSTCRIIEAFVAKLNVPTKYIRNESVLGAAKNFEMAIAKSTGEIVVLADQDDVWEVDKLVKMRQAADLFPSCLLLFSDGSCIDGNGKPLKYRLWDKAGRSRVQRLMRETGEQFSTLLGGDIVTGATMAIRRPLLDRALPIPVGWLHDAWLAVVAAVYEQIRGIDDCLIKYRVHKDQLVGVGRGNIIERTRILRSLGKERDLQKFLVLRERMSTFLNEAQRSELDAKIFHLQTRASLSTHAVKRVFQVLREAASGRYGRYSSGLPSIALDFLGH